MELNAEQIIKALECCKTPLASDCENCSYTGKRLEDGVYEGCVNCLVGDALALIKQLTEDNERLLARNFDLAEKGEKVVIAYKKLSEENERLNTAVPVWAKQCVELEERCMALGAEVADLQDELKCEKETNAHLCSQYMSESHLRHQAEEMLAQGISVVRANTVMEMQKRLEKRIASAEYSAKTDRKTVKKEELIEQVNWVLHKVVPDTIDQIAKEMLEGEK